MPNTSTIWWQIYPLGFVDGEGSLPVDAEIRHRLPQIEAWLDYVVELGCTGLALSPIFASSTHGYDTIDYLRIDPRLGDDADFDALIAAAHARGLQVLLDGVFNHVGLDFPAFQRAMREGPSAPEAAWFHLTWPEGGGSPDYKCFEGHRQLVTLKHAEPAVAAFVAGVMNHWLARGADGWRLDAAYAVPPAFWAGVLPAVRAAHPDAYIVGEVIHGDYVRIVRESGMDAVTQYELWKAIWSALNDRNLFELAWALTRHNEFLNAFTPLTFVGNHDVTRLASKLSDTRHIAHALAILFMVGGTPSIYAGDERGFTGVKENRAGGDDAIRPAFPASPAELPPEGQPIFALHQELIALRRRHPWLTEAKTETLHLANQQASFLARAGDSTLILALNLGDAAASLTVPFGSAIEAGAGTLSGTGSAGARLDLAPFGWAVLARAV